MAKIALKKKTVSGIHFRSRDPPPRLARSDRLAWPRVFAWGTEGSDYFKELVKAGEAW